MVTFYKLFTSFLMIALLVFGLLSFGIQFQSENNVEDPFVENQLINETYGTLQTDLNSYGSESQLQKSLFESDEPLAGFGSILLFSILSAGKVFNGMVVGTFNTLIKLPIVILGVDPVIVSVLGTLLIFSIIMGLWILYKLGG